jgi:hypothetical protein
MSTCDITSGFTLGCRDNSGGIKNLIHSIWFNHQRYVDASEGLIWKLFPVQVNFSSSSCSVKLQISLKLLRQLQKMELYYYEQTVNAVFFKLQSSTRNQVRVLAQNPNLKIIVETNNGYS